MTTPAPKRPQIEVRPDVASLSVALADFIVTRFNETKGRFALNLSGGSTPKKLYELLATEAYRHALDWERVDIFFGDERFVPKDHPDSNYKMARDAMLSHVPVPDENVYRVATESGSPTDGAAAYAATLKRYYGEDTLDRQRPLFHVTLLGLGDDGHTASLFPGTAALTERQDWVTSVVGAKPEPRITMTYPILNASEAVVFLVAGAAKREILARVLDHDAALPASHVEPEHGFYVFCDKAAIGGGSEEA